MHPQYYGLLTIPGSQEAMRMLFLNQSSESNKALDLPTRGGPFAKEEVTLLANSWIFSGLTDGEINKIMDSAKPCWYLSQVDCVLSYFMIQVVQRNGHYYDFIFSIPIVYWLWMMISQQKSRLHRSRKPSNQKVSSIPRFPWLGPRRHSSAAGSLRKNAAHTWRQWIRKLMY